MSESTKWYRWRWWRFAVVSGPFFRQDYHPAQFHIDDDRRVWWPLIPGWALWWCGESMAMPWEEAE